MTTTTTPNMGLTLPVPGSEPGPAWASELVAAQQVVDAHDHSPGKGASIPNSAVYSTQTWDFDDRGMKNVGFLAFDLDLKDPTLPMQLYADGNGELHWVDNAGHDLKLTLGGALNLTSNRGINGDYATDVANPSLFYTTSTKRYTQTSDGSTLATLRTGGLLLGVKSLAVSTGYTITDTDGVTLISCDTTSGTSRNVNLPLAANNPGRLVVVKDAIGSAASRNINVRTTGGDTIDGASSQTISTNFGTVRAMSDGTRWLVV